MYIDGNGGLYTVAGDGTKAWEAALNETGQAYKSQDLIMESRKVKFDRVLDLTDPKTLEHLGITTSKLKEPSKGNLRAYELTQQIGDLAKRHGFDAIKVPSQFGHNNIVILLKD